MAWSVQSLESMIVSSLFTICPGSDLTHMVSSLLNISISYSIGIVSSLSLFVVYVITLSLMSKSPSFILSNLSYSSGVTD